MSVPAGSHRRELQVCLVVVVAIVALRSVVPVCFEQIFDADQAVYGLMAKHLSEGRAFPLFFYGQNYLLGVQRGWRCRSSGSEGRRWRCCGCRWSSQPRRSASGS